MAYFTRNKMIRLALSMYEEIEWFREGPTDDRAKDLHVLIACQQRSLVLGEYMESMGMDYSDIVSIIEDGCNILYDMAENLDDPYFVMEGRLAFLNKCARLVQEIENRIVEITSIDVYDFRGLTSTKKESLLVEKEINRLIDNCIMQTAEPIEIGMEICQPLVVGTY